MDKAVQLFCQSVKLESFFSFLFPQAAKLTSRESEGSLLAVCEMERDPSIKTVMGYTAAVLKI